jgi:hypothetical protein
MKSKEKYQACLDRAYEYAPFQVIHTHDLKHETLPSGHRTCRVCGNRRLRYICECQDKDGQIWYIGRDCHTKLQERYEEEHK